MKNFILKLLSQAKKIPPYIFIWLSLPVVAISLSYIFEDSLALNPKGTLSTVILLLMIAFLVWFVINLYLPIEKVKRDLNKEKRTPFKRKRMFRFKLGGRNFTVPFRALLFFFIGLFYVIYFFVSTIFFKKLGDSSLVLIPIFIFFPIFYLIISLILFGALEVAKKFYRWLYAIEYNENEDEDENEEVYKWMGSKENPLYDFAGFYTGSIVAGVILVAAGIGGIIILTVKGSIWLVQHPYPWGILTIGILLLAICAFFIYKKCREFNEFLYSLSFFSDFKI